MASPDEIQPQNVEAVSVSFGDKHSSDVSCDSARPYLSAGSAETLKASCSSTQSPTDSRTVTPEPSETASTASRTVSEDGVFDPRNTNLDFFHKEAVFNPRNLVGSFTKVKGLSECCRSDGKVELHEWEDKTVVVKRVALARVGANVGKESNERVVCRGFSHRHAEDCLNEIGVYCYLAKQSDLPQYILKMHTAFQASTDAWLVLEHANDGDLFAVAQRLKRQGTTLSTCQLMTWTWQLLQAVRYLHSHAIGHRDISMENVLLCNGTVRLMDFGQSVRTHSTGGVLLRYFTALGKPYYRPPECHCPMQSTVDVNVPSSAQPGEVAFVRTSIGDTLCEVLLPPTAVPGKVCAAEPWGYAVTPIDVFACGVCMFIMATGMPPWRQANLADQHFAWVHQCSIAHLLKAWKKPLPASASELMSAMVQSDPTKRPSAQECLSHSWFSPLADTEVPVHDLVCSESKSTSAEAICAFDQPDFLVMPSFSSIADPYREAAVCRSVDTPSASKLRGFTACGGILEGDFYNMPEDNVVRSAAPHLHELTLQRFSAVDLPPKAPTGASFSFEPTTFHVSRTEASELANNLVDFLTMAAGTVVKKVSNSKFTIKADMTGEDGTCTLKVRIYDEGDGMYAVEFQRRAGESCAFHKIFDLTSSQFAMPAKPARAAEVDGKQTEATSPTHLSEMETLARSTWPLSQASVKSLAKPSAQRPRVLRPSTIAKNRSASLTNALAGTSSKASKAAALEKIESLTSDRATPVGSGLNAVRWRAKCNSQFTSSDFQPSVTT